VDWAAAALAVALLVKLAGRMVTSERRRTRAREMTSDLEMGLLLLSATYVFLSVVEGSPRRCTRWSTHWSVSW